MVGSSNIRSLDGYGRAPTDTLTSNDFNNRSAEMMSRIGNALINNQPVRTELERWQALIADNPTAAENLRRAAMSDVTVKNI